MTPLQEIHENPRTALPARPASKPDHEPPFFEPKDLAIIEATDVEELRAHVDAWEALARDAIEPNPFFEHWMLVPAFEAFGKGLDVRVLFIYGTSRSGSGKKVLCGVIPLEKKQRFKGLPVSTLSLWRHRYCFLSVPLLRAGCADACLHAFFGWLREWDQSVTLMEFQRVPADGPFAEALAVLLHETQALTFLDDTYPRALLRPFSDAEQYLNAAISREHRKDLRRRTRRLSEQGYLQFRELASEAESETWLERFLQLEQSGWKGREGGAFACRTEDREYFLAIMRSGFERGRLMMLAIELDGAPISLKCNFIAGEGAFAFKIAYDERYSRYSPGLLLEIENIRRVHDGRKLRWMDSCASPEHPMIDRLWLDRRVIQNIVVPAGRGWGQFWVSVLPLMRLVKRKAATIKLWLGKGRSSEEIK